MLFKNNKPSHVNWTISFLLIREKLSNAFIVAAEDVLVDEYAGHNLKLSTRNEDNRFHEFVSGCGSWWKIEKLFVMCFFQTHKTEESSVWWRKLLFSVVTDILKHLARHFVLNWFYLVMNVMIKHVL